MVKDDGLSDANVKAMKTGVFFHENCLFILPFVDI